MVMYALTGAGTSLLSSVVGEKKSAEVSA